MKYSPRTFAPPWRPWYFSFCQNIGTCESGTISPFKNISPYLLVRDLPMMVFLSLLIAVFGCNYRRLREPKTIGRVAGAFWLLLFAAYMALMLWQEAK